MSKLTVALVFVATIFGFSMSAGAQKAAKGGTPSLVGTWDIVRTERIDGPTQVPVPAARGLLIFDSAGNVFEIDTQNDRQVFTRGSGGGGGRGGGPTPEEALPAFNTFQGMWGTYKQDEKAGTLTYHALGAVNPSLMGQDTVRSYSWDGDHLVVTSHAGESNREGVIRWTWQRIPPIENQDAAFRKLVGFWQWVGDKSVDVSTGATITESHRDLSVIVYSPSGFIGTLWPAANRKPLAGAMATPDEAKADIAGFVGYIAVLTLHPGKIFHHQLVTIAPGGGGSLEREFEFVGNEVHLNFPPTNFQGQMRQTRVVLRRLSGWAEMEGK